ncbi:MAG: TonB-dependent receptor plug domain-containing protein [Reichenbachiella sp.]|uniref:TonB-dependent receptor plug domain-containing protein n=1 Tax=Reichenbachiella sp. TaxID=2184521 RepID=UPI003267DB2E
MSIRTVLLRFIVGTQIFVGACFSLNAQPDTKKPIIEIFGQLSKAHQVTFSYNNLLLENLNADVPSSTEELSEALEELSSSLPIRFEIIGDKYYTVIPIRSNLTLDVKDRQTGENIPVLLVQLADKQAHYLYPSPDSFVISSVFPTDSVRISSRFYQPFNFSVQQLDSEPLIWLDQDTLYLEDVMVKSYIISGIDANIESQSVTINTADLGLIAGETDGDVLQVLKTIPGIKSPTGKAGALMMRGSTYDQNLMYFDDIPLYHTGHYFGTISPYNQAIIDEIEVYRGSLPLEWGGRVGGLINIRTNPKIPKQVTGGVLANTIYSGAHATVPLIKDKAAFSISGRVNYPNYSSEKMDSFTTLNMQGSKVDENIVGGNSSLDEFDVKFNDLNAKLIFKPGDKHEFTYSAMRIYNDFGFLFSSDNQDLVETEKSGLNNWGMTTKWTGKWSDKWRSALGATVSVFDLTEERIATRSGVEEEVVNSLNTIEDIRFRASIVYESNETTIFRAGYELTSQQVDFEESGTDRGGNPVYKQTNSLAHIQSGYVSVKKWLNSQLLLDGGIHMDHYSITQRWYADPRAMLSYFLSKDFYLKTSAGISHQYLQRQFSSDFDDFRVSNQFWFLANKNLPVQSGSQYMIGGMLDKSGWLVDVELYKKNIENISRQGDANAIETGTLETFGADLLVKKRFSSVDLWCSYTLSNSQTDFTEKEYAYFDQTHVLNLMFLIPRERWDFSLAWGLMSGMPVRIPDDTSPNQPSGTLDIPYEGRFPVQHQLDLSATYLFSKPASKWRGVIGLSVLNLYNKGNLINIFQTNVDPDTPLRQGVGISPNLQVSISW